jgi:aminopeptidase N
MTLQGYREIVGDDVFFAFARAIQERFGYGNISTATFIELALDSSGLDGAQLDLLVDYFEQWLYGEARPTILPESFD